MKALHTWFAAEIRPGTDVIFANQDGRRPALPFATLLVTSAVRAGHASIGRADTNGQATVRQDQTLSVSVQVFGPEALAIAEELRDRFEAPSAQTRLAEQGFAFVRVLSGVNDAAETIGAGWEPRAQFDVELRTLREFTDEVGLIERVELTGTVNDHQHTETIEV